MNSAFSNNDLNNHEYFLLQSFAYALPIVL
jgi:hypothetical protein